MNNPLRRLVMKLLFLFLPFFVIFVGIEYISRHVPNSVVEKKSMFEKSARSTVVLVLGASHALDGINPEYFACCGFNLSNVSQSLYYDAEICIMYLDRLPRLKAVIITMYYPSLWYELHDSAESWRDYLYYRAYGIKYPGLKTFSVESVSYAAIYPRKLLTQYWRNPDRFASSRIQPNGWLFTDIPQDSSGINDEEGLARFKYHSSLVTRANLPRNIQHVERLMNELRERNIKIFFVTVPVYKTYSKYFDQYIVSENHRIITELCLKYQSRYLDYANDQRFLISDFSDNDHLNREGARKFSMILNQDIISQVCRAH